MIKCIRHILLIISLGLACFISFFFAIDDVNCMSLLLNDNKSLKDDYAMLRETTVMYAKTLDINSIPENISITHMLEKESIVIISDNGICKVESQYPIEVETQGDGKFVTNILYEQGTYKQYYNQINKFEIAFYILLFICLMTFTIYWIMYLTILGVRIFVLKSYKNNKI